MDFHERLERALGRVLTEAEFDYTNDWERFRQEREQLRKQAAEDQRAAADREINKELQDKITRAGGFSNWVAGKNPNWQPPEQFEIIEDIETSDGILLPSLRQKGKELHLFIPWALVEYRNPTSNHEGEILKIFPFCQFDIEGWPNQSDFEWDTSRPYSSTGIPEPHDKDPNYYFTHDTTWNKRQEVNVKAAIRLFESDKNHYHMLRGEDKKVVDLLVENRVEEWFYDHQQTESPEDYL